MKEIRSIVFPNATLPIAKATVHNGLMYVSGSVGFKPGTTEPLPTIKEQTEAIIRGFNQLFKQEGTDVSRLVRVNVYLTDVQRDFAAMNEVFRQWVGDHRPARTTVGAQLAIPGLLIEIDCVVALD